MSKPKGQIPARGGNEHLRSFRLVEAVYDATVVFCERFFDRRSPIHDRTVYSARTAVRSMKESKDAAATSQEKELKLANQAWSSLSDLAKDYRDFITQRGLCVWSKDSPDALTTRERIKHDVAPNLPALKEGEVRLTGLLGLSALASKAKPEMAANVMLCSVNQAAYLLKKQIDICAGELAEATGPVARLYALVAAQEAEAEAAVDAPDCPLCGKAMRKLTAKRGPKKGRSYWGCSGYPECKGVLGFSDKGDESGKSDETGDKDS